MCQNPPLNETDLPLVLLLDSALDSCCAVDANALVLSDPEK
jgi:hypothetical protein